MNLGDIGNFQRLHILAEVCSKEMTGQATLVGDLLNDHKFTLKILGHPIKIINTEESKSTLTKKRLYYPFTPYTMPPFIKVKRKRASPWQVAILRGTFTRCQFSSSEERKCLAENVGMTERTVQIWFQNSRQMIKGNKNMNKFI